jgi:hypothetical protein
MREQHKSGQDGQLEKARPLRNYYCQIQPQEIYSLHTVWLLGRTSCVTNVDVEQRRKASITDKLQTLKTADKNNNVHRAPTGLQGHKEVADGSKLKLINL